MARTTARRAAQISMAALATAFLTGCMGVPMATGPRVIPAPDTGGVASAPSGSFGAGMDSATAEAACRAEGQERGLQVLGVAGSRVVTGTDGSEGRDLLLRVARNGSQLEVRCNYQPATGARIMLI